MTTSKVNLLKSMKTWLQEAKEYRLLRLRLGVYRDQQEKEELEEANNEAPQEDQNEQESIP